SDLRRYQYNLNAVSYNLENGKIVEAKLDKKSVFTETINNKWSRVKFSLPNLKEGTIFEIEYTQYSDFIFNFQPWEYQGPYPRLWSEFKAHIPQFTVYLFLEQGYHPYYINSTKNYTNNFSVSTIGSSSYNSGRATFLAGVTEYRWVRKDVSRIKRRKFYFHY